MAANNIYFTVKDECTGHLWKGFGLALYYGTIYRLDKITNDPLLRARIVALDGSTTPQLVMGEFIDRLGEDGKIVACTATGKRLGSWIRAYDKDDSPVQPLPPPRPDNPIGTNVAQRTVIPVPAPVSIVPDAPVEDKPADSKPADK